MTSASFRSENLIIAALFRCELTILLFLCLDTEPINFSIITFHFLGAKVHIFELK